MSISESVLEYETGRHIALNHVLNYMDYVNYACIVTVKAGVLIHIGQEQVLTSVCLWSLTRLTTVLCMCIIIFYFVCFKNSGTQLPKKVAATPVKTLSQTTNAVASTVQPPAVIQVGSKLCSTVE